jgi:phospho-N-acetylmuramoyl-pentapeptide-transferase
MRSLLTAAAISLAFTLFLTPVFLRLFRAWGWGQVIRTPETGNNPRHGAKRGTPTMGGTIFIVGTIVGYFIGAYVGNNPPTISGLMVLWLMVGFGVVGFIDDYLKVRSQRSLGLSGWRKVIGQVIVVVPFAVVGLSFPNLAGTTPASPYVSVFRDVPILYFFALAPIIGWLIYLAWIMLIGVAASKANVFMGDVGSMAIGGVIAAMAILTRTELLMVLVAGVYVIASGSVILQRLYFKLTRGKRLFLMSPLHHHLEMRGWSEVTIVVRMWIIAGLLAVSGVGLFYVEWLTRT